MLFRSDIEVTVQMNRRTGAVVPANHVDARILRGVLVASDRRQQLDVRAVSPQLVADDAGAGFVLFTGWIDSGDPDQSRRKIDDFIGCTIDFHKHAIN